MRETVTISRSNARILAENFSIHVTIRIDPTKSGLSVAPISVTHVEISDAGKSVQDKIDRFCNIFLRRSQSLPDNRIVSFRFLEFDSCVSTVVI